MHSVKISYFKQKYVNSLPLSLVYVEYYHKKEMRFQRQVEPDSNQRDK